MRTLPTKQEVLDVLNKLISDELTREQVSSWATAIMDDDEIPMTDGIVWDALEKLGASDLIATDRPFLYEVKDFVIWRDSLKVQMDQ